MNKKNNKQPIISTDIFENVDSLIQYLPANEKIVSWVKNGNGVIGWGEACVLRPGGLECYARAHEWWQNILHANDLKNPVTNSPARAFASFSFDFPSTNNIVIVPQVLIGKNKKGSWITTVNYDINKAKELSHQTKKANIQSKRSKMQSRQSIKWLNNKEEKHHWIQNTKKITKRIKTGEVDKVVLARLIHGNSKTPIDINIALQKLNKNFHDCWIYCVNDFIGATPELLIKKNQSKVLSRVLAGTTHTTDSEVDNKLLAQKLLASSKNLEEHNLAVQSVYRSLGPHCTNISFPKQPTILKLPNVQHLSTEIKGTLVDNAPAVALAGSLHPSAAVCGTPTERAKAIIYEVENMNRSRYSGPIGWIGNDGDGEFGIALRCGQIDDTSITAFAGCGIVEDSQPKLEWEESESKFKVIKSLFS